MFGSSDARQPIILTRVNKRVTLLSKMAQAGACCTVRRCRRCDAKWRLALHGFQGAQRQRRVSSTTRERVLDACQKLRSSPTTTQLASTSSTRFVGLVVTSIVDPFYGEIIAARALAFTLEHDIAYAAPTVMRSANAASQLVLRAQGERADRLARKHSREPGLLARHFQPDSVVFIDHALLEGSHLVATDHHRPVPNGHAALAERGVSPAYLGALNR